MGLKIANNATSVLAGSIDGAATSFSVTAGNGAKFPTLGAGDWFPLTIVDANGNYEIVRCTARATDLLTIQRAQEGTTAASFSAGDRVDLRLTAAALGEFLLSTAGLRKSDNLSDVADAAAALSNLGGVSLSREVLSGGLVTGGGNLAGDVELSVAAAVKSDIDTGTDVSKATTPQAVSDYVKGRTGTSPGNLVQLDPSTGKLPAVDGSELTNVQNIQQALVVVDQKAAGSLGGTFTAGAWRTRDLNTVLVNTIPSASVSSNQIHLPAGTYDVQASAPAYQVQDHFTQLYDVTHGVQLVPGSAEYAGTSVGVAIRSLVAGRFTLAAAAVVELQHYCRNTINNQGLGTGTGDQTIPPIYAQAVIRKII